MSDEYKTIKYDIENNICMIVLNRPKKRNSISLELSEELNDLLIECSENDEVKVIIITGEGETFCSGGDLTAIRDSADISYFLEKISKSYLQVLFKIRNIKKPVITAINGPAFGAGLGLILASDIRLAISNAELNTGFSRIGGSASAGTTYFLPRMIGIARATELLLLGETIKCDKAVEIGLVNRSYENIDELMEETVKLAMRLSQGPTAALAKTKMLLNQSADNSLIPQLEAESNNLSLSGETEDLKEGLDAFIEKREPVFKGK
jgi:2-(1,2-epoxy-1,2-dihydrophenyl)acetyl-CoA isomerase